MALHLLHIQSLKGLNRTLKLELTDKTLRYSFFPIQVISD